MSTVLTSIKYSDSPSDSDVKSEGSSIPPLGAPYHVEKKFFWQKSSDNNLDAIATQVCRQPPQFITPSLLSPSQVYSMTLFSRRSISLEVTGKCLLTTSMSRIQSIDGWNKGKHPPLQSIGTVDMARGKGRREKGRLENHDLDLHHVHRSGDRPREYRAGRL